MSLQLTQEQLAAYDGKNGQPIYVAVRGTIYDVTPGASFYGPEGPYACFAGRECARALGLMKIDEAECSDDLHDLTDKQLQTLQDWVKRFTAKYMVVGKINNRSVAPGGAGSKSSPENPPHALNTRILRQTRLVAVVAVVVVACAAVAAVAFLPRSGQLRAEAQ